MNQIKTNSRDGFTLIELLVVIAIIAIISVVVILTLNPAELLRQSRDSNRLSDMATINEAIGIYSEDIGGSLGLSTTTYISVPDPSATTTAGDQCQGLGLLVIPSGWGYHCAASSTYRNVNGNGWLPINFSVISSQSPFGTLPVDPVNTTSSGLYYSYIPGSGSGYQVIAVLESQKYKTNTTSVLGTGLVVVGNNIPASPVAWYKFDEGSGSTAIDSSGNGNNGTWSGTPSGQGSTYYTSGKVGSYAGYFDGSTDFVDVPTKSILNVQNSFTLSEWVKTSCASECPMISKKDNSPYPGYTFAFSGTSGIPAVHLSSVNGWEAAVTAINNNAWHFLVWTYDGANTNIYVDGNLDKSYVMSQTTAPTTDLYIGTDYFDSQRFSGAIDDARVYARPLSPGEIQAIYFSEK